MIVTILIKAVMMVAGILLALVPDLPMDALVDSGIISEYMTVMTEYIRIVVGVLRYIYGSRLLDFTFLTAGALIVFDVVMVVFRFIIGKFFMK